MHAAEEENSVRHYSHGKCEGPPQKQEIIMQPNCQTARRHLFAVVAGPPPKDRATHVLFELAAQRLSTERGRKTRSTYNATKDTSHVMAEPIARARADYFVGFERESSFPTAVRKRMLGEEQWSTLDYSIEACTEPLPTRLEALHHRAIAITRALPYWTVAPRMRCRRHF
jgi:hypothetical protein